MNYSESVQLGQLNSFKTQNSRPQKKSVECKYFMHETNKSRIVWSKSYEICLYRGLDPLFPLEAMSNNL